MPSAIDSSLPITGSPTTASVRANFAAAKSEIEALQVETAYLITAVTTLGSEPSYFANNAVTLTRGAIQAFAAATPQQAQFPTVLNGAPSSQDTGSNQLRAANDGYYQVEWVILPRGDSATATVTPTLTVNGVDVLPLPTISATTSLAIPQRISTLRRFTAGDVIGLKLSFSVAGGLKSRSAATWNDDNRASLVRISNT